MVRKGNRCTYAESYIKTFANGTYTFRAKFTNGYADLTLVLNVPAPPTPTAQSTPTAVTLASTTTTSSTSLKTDDESNVSLWFALFIIAGVSIAGAMTYRQRKHSNQ